MRISRLLFVLGTAGMLAACTKPADDTAKGALIHRLIRTRRAVLTAATHADAASPGVSDALADLVCPSGSGRGKLWRRDFGI